uniref:VIT domain-containing protein n=1 Tax=Astyanax mexicanus TaxID=7994 RepID=A0A3B1KJ46_ASTMX
MNCKLFTRLNYFFLYHGLVLKVAAARGAGTGGAAALGTGTDVEISSFHINSTVTSRYAITVITSRVKNQHTDSKEIHFEVKIPKNAFISKFRMTIEGKTYDGVVKEKEAAQQQYSEAVARGESAGVVSSVGRTLEEFKTSVTVAALSKVTFELTYEELLQRRHGKYDLLINAQPMQPVADFKVHPLFLHTQATPLSAHMALNNILFNNN